VPHHRAELALRRVLITPLEAIAATVDDHLKADLSEAEQHHDERWAHLPAVREKATLSDATSQSVPTQ
jgi:hypothetical protein